MEFIAPYQTVCSYWNYFIHFLGEHWSQTSALGGTVQNQGVKLANLFQPNTIANTESSRNWDVPPGVDPVGAKVGDCRSGRIYRPFNRLGGAIDAQGNADCGAGQDGFVRGPLSNARYGPGTLADGTPTGGNFPVTGCRMSSRAAPIRHASSANVGCLLIFPARVPGVISPGI